LYCHRDYTAALKSKYLGKLLTSGSRLIKSEVHIREPSFTVLESTRETYNCFSYILTTLARLRPFTRVRGYCDHWINRKFTHFSSCEEKALLTNMRTATNFHLANLALAGLLTLICCIPGLALKGFITHHAVCWEIAVLCKFSTMNYMTGISVLGTNVFGNKNQRA